MTLKSNTHERNMHTTLPHETRSHLQTQSCAASRTYDHGTLEHAREHTLEHARTRTHAHAHTHTHTHTHTPHHTHPTPTSTTSAEDSKYLIKFSVTVLMVNCFE